MVAPARDADTATPPSVGQRFQELLAFGSYYAAAQVDRFKLTAINIAMFAVVGVIVAVVGVAVVLTSSVLLVVGIAGGLGALLGGRAWLGDLIVAVIVLGTTLIGTLVGFKMAVGTSRAKLVASYDRRKREQRASFGTDVREQSRAA